MDGKRITTDYADDIDFSVMRGVNTIPIDIVNNVTGDNYSIQISLAYEGEFCFTTVLSIDLGRENAGLTASLYYYNESTGELEFVCKDKIAQDGTAKGLENAGEGKERGTLMPAIAVIIIIAAASIAAVLAVKRKRRQAN